MDYNPLENFRKQINNINDEMMILLKRRIQFAKKVAKYKLENDIKVENLQRDDDILKEMNKKAISMGLSESFIRNLFQLVLDESKREQEKFETNLKRKKK